MLWSQRTSSFLPRIESLASNKNPKQQYMLPRRYPMVQPAHRPVQRFYPDPDEALLKEVHLLGQGAAVPMAQAQGPSAVEEAPAPAPGVEDPIVGHLTCKESRSRANTDSPMQLI